MPEIALNPPPFKHAGGTGGVRAPPTTGAPPRRRWSGTAQRVISLLRRGMQLLRWLLAQGRCWVRWWLRPEPLRNIGDSGTMHIYDPSQCLKSPKIPPLSSTRGGLGGCGEPTGRVGTTRGADAALGPQRAAARPGGRGAGGSGGGAPPAAARHLGAAGLSHHGVPGARSEA